MFYCLTEVFDDLPRGQSGLWLGGALFASLRLVRMRGDSMFWKRLKGFPSAE